jgi:CRP-like cAMP-binding protein
MRLAGANPGRVNVAQAEPKVLAGMELLEDLSPEDLVELERHCRYRRFAAGEQIFDRNARTRDVFFVVRGRVRIVNYSLAGREVALDDITRGGYFGELAAIDGQPRSANVMAVADSVIVALPATHFLAALEAHPKLALRLMRALAGMVRASTERIMDLSTLGANNRALAELLRQANQSMNGENRAVLSPIPVHSDLASRASTTRETVARVMNDLARQGLVERTKDALIVCDMRHLQDLVTEVRGE